MRRSLSSCLRPHHLGATLATSVCAGALLASPGITQAFAAPTIGGDENGPQVQILQPGYQDVLKGKTKILVAVKAQKFNPQFVEMFIDDKPATTGPITLGTQPSAQYDWDTKLFTDGAHKLTVRITDTQGFRGWAEVNVFINNDKKIDSIPPSLSWKNINGYQMLSGKSQINLDAIDNFGVKWLVVTINPAAEPNKKPALRSWLLNRPPYAVNFDTTAVPDGLYKLTAKAWDSFDQEGNATALTVGVVNGGTINATTIGDMLNGLRKMDSSAPTTTKVNAATKFTVETPADSTDSASSAANIYTPRAAAPKAAAPAKAVVNAAGVATKANIAPSAPAMIVRDTKSAVKAPTLVAKTEGADAATGLAAPALSGKAPATTTAPSTLSGEIDGAVNDDWRGRMARLAVPAAEASTEGALSSSSQSDRLSISRLAASSLTPESELTGPTGRTALPAGTERAFTSDASQHPADEKPVLSQKSIGGLRVAAKDPVQLEAGSATAADGRLSAPTRIASRPENLEVATPMMSAPQASVAPRVAPRIAAAPTVESDNSAQARMASPEGGAQRSFEGAQFSSIPATPRTQVSAKLPVVKTDVAKSGAPVKSVSPDHPRIAALPRPVKSGQMGAINAITVSPVEVKTSDSIPAFHVSARASDLRAVAARYGLPVEVVAACNNWSSDKTLVAGEKVKLPQQLKVSYQGVPVKSDVHSMLVGGTGVTAFRFMFQQAGGQLEWDAKKQRVIARKGNSEVTLTIGSNKAKVGEKEVMMELAAFLFEGRTMVPVRFFEEGLKAQVEWDPQTGRLVVAMAN